MAPKPFDGGRHGVYGKINLFESREPTEPEPEARSGHVLSRTHRQQDVAWLGVGRGARGTGADGHVAHGHHKGLAIDVREAHVQVARQTNLGMAIETESWHAGPQTFEQAVAQLAEALRFLLEMTNRDLHGQPEPNDERDGKRPTTKSALVAATVEERLEPYLGIPATDVERADPLGAVNLMS